MRCSGGPARRPSLLPSRTPLLLPLLLPLPLPLPALFSKPSPSIPSQRLFWPAAMAITPLCASLTDALFKVDQAVDKLGELKKECEDVRKALLGLVHKANNGGGGAPHGLALGLPAASPTQLMLPPLGPSPSLAAPKPRAGDAAAAKTPEPT